jgi:predicted phosphodiesterase
MSKAYRQRAVLLSLLCVVLGSLAAYGRGLDGTLDLIRLPISTVPVIVKAGEHFDLTIASSAPVEEMRVALYQGPNQKVVFTHAATETPLQPKEGSLTVQIAVPPDTVPGLYSLSARVNPGGRNDTSERAVKVVGDWPASYRFAHVTDVHIGRAEPPLRDEVFRRTASEINKLGVDFVLLTGDLTDNGTPEQFRRFLEILDHFDAPTFAVPGNHDRGGATASGGDDIYGRYCGPGSYAFDFGTHRYLGLDTRWQGEFLVPPGQRAWLEAQLARPQPSCGVAFSHRISDSEYPYFEEQLPPKNYRLFLYGHTHRDGIKWIGPRRLILLNTSQALNGTYDVVKIEADAVVAIDHVHRVSND